MGVSSLMVSYIVEPPTNAVKVYHRQFQLNWWSCVGSDQIHSSVKSPIPDFILHRQHIYGLVSSLEFSHIGTPHLLWLLVQCACLHRDLGAIEVVPCPLLSSCWLVVLIFYIIYLWFVRYQNHSANLSLGFAFFRNQTYV